MSQDVAFAVSNRTGFKNTDRHLEEPLRREINLIVAHTLGQLRSESLIHIRDTVNDGPIHFVLGPKLGEGGFSSVYEVQGEPTLACKFLSAETLSNKERLPTAAADIVREAHFLSHLEHPNIIALRGIGSLDDMAQYYLLIDKIQTPLSAKIEEWGLATAENEQLHERLVYAMSIVQAMKYLHSLKIVYRDLKIDNLGLDAKNQILLYDFGLAKTLSGQSDNGKYKLTGNTGSWAYMAPEVAKGYKYNFSVDVYSFGIVLWELCNGKFAFEGKQFDKEARPSIFRGVWPKALEILMMECWHWNPNQRPSFVQIEERLTAIMEELHSSGGASSILSWFKDSTMSLLS
jgi:serine/threonine protein kinase